MSLTSSLLLIETDTAHLKEEASEINPSIVKATTPVSATKGRGAFISSEP